jgi:hypothetical protein
MAQNNRSKLDSIRIPKTWFNGLRLELNVAPIINSLLLNKEVFGYEAAIQANILKKYYPVLEMGFAGADHMASNDIIFKTNGLYSRVGVDLNIIKPKAKQLPTNNLFLVGVRVGFSNFKYDLNNVILTDEYWGQSQKRDFIDEKASKVWFEISAGMRVEVVKKVYMGWTIRSKNFFKEDAVGELNPWYVPGYGISSGSKWSLVYAIGYSF